MTSRELEQSPSGRHRTDSQLPGLGNGRIVLLAIAAIVVVHAHSLFLCSGKFELLSLVERGYAQPEAIDEYSVQHGERASGRLELLFRIVLVVGFSLWWRDRIRIWRLVRDDAPTVGWGIASWFVPFANWFVPFDHLCRFARDFGVRVPIRLWQIGFVCMQVFGASTALLAMKIQDARDLRLIWYMLMIEDVITIVAGLAMSCVVIGLSQRTQRTERGRV